MSQCIQGKPFEGVEEFVAWNKIIQAIFGIY